MNSEKDFLMLSETFYSVQGEGPSIGRPAVFMRLSACNLRCPGFSYQHPQTGEHLGCDTLDVWRKGEKKSFAEMIQYWRENAWLEKLNLGARLIITGGEPTLHQSTLLNFLEYLKQSLPKLPWIELETNATILLEENFFELVNQINASPKLKHSGEPRSKAYKLDVLTQLAHSPKTIFKFVVATPKDIDEIYSDFIRPLNLNPSRIWLMPEGGTRAAIAEKSVWLVELCKKHLMNYSSRLHLDIWDEATGV